MFAGVAKAWLAGWWLPVAAAVGFVADQVVSDPANPWLVSATFLPVAVA